MSTIVHDSRPNEVTQLDYVFLRQRDMQIKYALVVKNDLSGYVGLGPSVSAESEYGAEVLFRWIGVFTAHDVGVSAQDSHFQNKVLNHFSSTYYIRHTFTAAYSP